MARKQKQERIAILESVIKSHEISIANGATPQYDDNGAVKQDIATCGSCGLSWNDALITGRTPAPSARCPYEYIHSEIAELARLKQRELSRKRQKWIIKYGSEYMEMDADGLISRPKINMPASGEWRVTGAVERNNFGHVVCRLTLADVKAACNALRWQYANGKQRIFITDLDHGTPREWRSPNHSVRMDVR